MEACTSPLVFKCRNSAQQIADPRRPGQGKSGATARSRANTSSPVRGALAQLAWLDTRVAAAGGLDSVLGRPQQRLAHLRRDRSLGWDRRSLGLGVRRVARAGVGFGAKCWAKIGAGRGIPAAGAHKVRTSRSLTPLPSGLGVRARANAGVRGWARGRGWVSAGASARACVSAPGAA